jgi:gamma-glutamyltranspeptidase/glutathione hydrolase
MWAVRSRRIVCRLVCLNLISGVMLIGSSPRCAAQTAKSSFEHGVVAADHAAASEAGARILRQGGNVVDAAVATSFALSVVRPASCGIGGGGFMVIWDAQKQQPVAIDYRERAPAAADSSLFGRPEESDLPEPRSVRGGLASGIPGHVAGLCYAAEQYGSLPLAALVQPAIDLCREGVEVDEHDMDVQVSTLAKLRKHSRYQERFALLLKLYLNDGTPWKKGDRFYSPQLKTLEIIAQLGPDGFYRGDVAGAMVATVASDGGVLTNEDLAGYSATVRQPLQASFHGRRLITMPPPSSGGVALLQTLQSLEAWENSSGNTLESLKHNSADYVHVVTEAMKHAFADRAEFLGDTDYVDVPIQRMLSPAYAKHVAARFDMQKTLSMEKYGRFTLSDDGGTSHFSVMDGQGNAVACTETINLTFGSFVVVPEFGILLNNQMDDFTANPGKPNAFGLIQSKANAVEPGKKPLSSMTPTIVVEDGQATYACGASGGPRIITATLQSLLNHLVFGMEPAAAVAAPRFHHQWSPEELLLERSLMSTTSTELAARGHKLQQASGLAATQAAGRADNLLLGGSDPRKHGHPAGH